MYTIDKTKKECYKKIQQYAHIYWTATTCDQQISLPLEYFSGMAKKITFVKAYMTTLPYLLGLNASSGSSSVFLPTNTIIINWDGPGTLVSTTPYDLDATITTEFMTFPVKYGQCIWDKSVVDDALVTNYNPTLIVNPNFNYSYNIDTDKTSLKFWIQYQSGKTISSSLNTASYKTDINWQFHLILLISN